METTLIPSTDSPMRRVLPLMITVGDFIRYANANQASTPLLAPDLRDDPGIYPTPEVKAKLRPNLTKSAEFTRELNRSWTRFMTGG